jgi:hypothetical protein
MSRTRNAVSWAATGNTAKKTPVHRKIPDEIQFFRRNTNSPSADPSKANRIRRVAANPEPRREEVEYRRQWTIG